MDALNYQRNHDGKEEINNTHSEDTSPYAITLAP